MTISTLRKVLAWTICCFAIAVDLPAQAQVAPPDFPFGRPLRPVDPGEPLPPDEAFRISVEASDYRTIVVRFAPAAGYYLYRDKFAFAVRDPAGIKVIGVRLPPGEIKDDPFFGRVETFHNELQALVGLQGTSAGSLVLDITYQGCNDKIGICYPVMKKQVRVELPAPANPR